MKRALVAVVVGALTSAAVLGVDWIESGNERTRARASAEAHVDRQAASLDVLLRRYVERMPRIEGWACDGLDGDGVEIDEHHVLRVSATGVAAREGIFVEQRTRGVYVAFRHLCPDGEHATVFDGPVNDFVEGLNDLVPVRIALDHDDDREVRRAQSFGDGPNPLHLETFVAIDRTPEAPTMIAMLLAAGAGLLVAFLTFLGSPRRDTTLEAAARRVGAGDLDVTLAGNNATASAFNRMTRDLRDARARLARAERIAAWRDIARRIAHEIKNPLTPIKMAMETVRKTHARKHPDFDEIFDESTKTVLEETARLEKIVTEFSRFARMPRPKAESMDVREVVERVVAMHDLGPANATMPEAAKGARVELRAAQKLLPSVRADREQLTQVLVNLVQNASDAAREKQGESGGRVVVSLTETEHGGVRIVVSDNGPGIPADARNAVLEPYYTTKSHGTGLGLAIVDRIVSDHGGTLEIGDDAELGGAAITIVLRREGPSEEPESSVGV